MSYNPFLDTYFSTYWISMGIPVFLMIAWLAGLRRVFLKNKEHTFGERMISIGVTTGLILIPGLVNPMYWGFGPPTAVREITFTDGKCLVVDHILTMGSKTDDGTPCSRVHVIDPKTGEKKLRFTLGEDADLVGVHGDTLVVARYSDAIGYSISDGHQYVTYSTETLPGLFPELSTGISNMMWGDQDRIMELTVNNGKQYNLYLTTGKLYPANDGGTDTAHYRPTGKLYIDDRVIKRDDEQWGTTVVEIDGKNGNQYEMFLQNSNDSVLNDKLAFLDAHPIALCPDSSIIILSYETLEHKQFLLTSVSLDGQKVNWTIHQSQYNAKYAYNDYEKPQAGYSAKDNTLCFAVGTTAYCVDAATGKLLWQTTL